jgi:GT2 family glycosyltransferase
MVRATVVIVTYNSAALIDRCLDAVRATVSAEDEVLVVDNASTDGTAAQVERSHPFVRLERSTRNLGFGAGCNLGAALARGSQLVFLNPDTEPRPGWLSALLAPLDAAGDSVMATAKVLLAARPNPVDTFGNEVHISGITTCRGWGLPADSYTQIEEVDAVSGACFAVSRRLFQRLGGFDERLFMYFEDTDLSLRARLAGGHCLAVPEAVVLHDHRAGFSPAKLRQLERNRYWTLLKVCQGRSLLALVPVLALAEVLAWGMAASSGWRHIAAKCLSWVDLVSWFVDLPAARHDVQRTRVVSDVELLRCHSTRLSFAQVSQGAQRQVAERFAGLLFGGARSVVSTFAR